MLLCLKDCENLEVVSGCRVISGNWNQKAVPDFPARNPRNDIVLSTLLVEILVELELVFISIYYFIPIHVIVHSLVFSYAPGSVLLKQFMSSLLFSFSVSISKNL